MGIYGINPKINFLTKILKKKKWKNSNGIENPRFNYQSFISKGIKFYFYLFIYLFQLSRSYISSIFSIPSMVR